MNSRDRAYNSPAARRIREYQDSISDSSVRVRKSAVPGVLVLLVAGTWLAVQLSVPVTRGVQYVLSLVQ